MVAAERDGALRSGVACCCMSASISEMPIATQIMHSRHPTSGGLQGGPLTSACSNFNKLRRCRVRQRARTLACNDTMSGKGDTPKDGAQGGVLDSIKQAGENVTSALSKKTGGSQVSLA